MKCNFGSSLPGRSLVGRAIEPSLSQISDASTGSGRRAGVDSFLLGGKNAEEAENANHLEGLQGERRRVHELGIASYLTSSSKRIDHRAYPGRIDEGHLLQIENEVDTTISEGGFERSVQFRNAGRLKLAFDAKGANISALLYVEIHAVSCKLERIISQAGARLLHSVYRD